MRIYVEIFVYHFMEDVRCETDWNFKERIQICVKRQNENDTKVLSESTRIPNEYTQQQRQNLYFHMLLDADDSGFVAT